MWRIFTKLAGGALRWVIGEAVDRVTKPSDTQLRAIARAIVGDGRRPFSVVLAEARDRIEAIGATLTDDLDRRLVDAIDHALAIVRLPDRLADMAKSVEAIESEFEAAERRGRKRPLLDESIVCLCPDPGVVTFASCRGVETPLPGCACKACHPRAVH